MRYGHHRVRTHKWKDGQLTYLDHVFTSFEEALTFAIGYDCNTFKIFDGNDCVVFINEIDQTSDYL